MHVHNRRALLVFAALFGRTFARPWNRDAAFLRDSTNGFWKFAAFQRHYEFKNIAAFVAAEAVIHLLAGAHAERRRLFLMERAQAAEILAGLFQAHVFADHADDVRLLFYPFRK